MTEDGLICKERESKVQFFIMQNVFLSDYNFVSNEGNLIIFFLRLKDIAEWNKIIVKKIKKWRRTGWKMEVKIFNFLSKLFRNKNFISQDSQILADV